VGLENLSDSAIIVFVFVNGQQKEPPHFFGFFTGNLPETLDGESFRIYEHDGVPSP
jgi:hypothetical protein